MTVKQKGQQPSFAGIVVTASTRGQAVKNYAAVAQQNNLEVLASADGSFMLATTAGSHDTFLNPLSKGKESMKVVDVEIESNSSNNEDVVSVHYTMCSECSTHIIADSCESVANCPSCHSGVDFDRELEDDLESDSSVEDGIVGEQGIVVAASSFEEAQSQFISLLADTNGAVNFRDGAASFVSNSADNVNFSPFSGEAVKQAALSSESSANLEALASDFDGNAHYYQCVDSDSCGMHVLSSNEDVTLCPSCSTALVDPEELQDLEQSVLAMDADLDEDELDDTDDLLDDDDDLDDLDDLDEDDADLDEELDDDFEVVASSDEDDDEDDSDDDDLDDEDEDDSDDEDEDDDDGIDGLDDEEDEDDDDVESDSSNVTASINVMSVVANTTEGGLAAESIALVNCGTVAGQNRWIAMHGETPIAVASESNVTGAAKDIFRNQNFATATLNAIAADGVQKGLEQFGFKAVAFDDQVVTAAISNQIIGDADAKVLSYNQAQEQRDSVLMERVQSALATSMMGINRGVFAGKTNPLIESMASALKAAGIQNARELVDNVFEANADNFNKMVVDQTQTLLSKSQDSQNEIAQMVASASYARKEGTQSVSQTFENRLQPRVVETQKPAAAPMQSQSSSANFKNRARSVLSGLK